MESKSDKIEAISRRLIENASTIRYGSVAVDLRIHDGRVVDVTHRVTETLREKSNTQMEEK